MSNDNKLTVQVQDSSKKWMELKADRDAVLMRVITGAKMEMEASCDGECACSTCHVYVDTIWLDHLEPPTDEELMMIEYTDKPKANSRLACQIKLKPELNGMRVQIVGK
ncbi:MAG: 2Fe-2S iron-sulfur cluster-binding protein [Spirochaetia bacterium]|nr:2Fe-2S iron-sulfur cluster-binding protein [Spirochaetia bacterium]